MTPAYILFGKTGFCTSQMCFGIVWEDFFFFFSGGGRKKVPYRTGLSIARVCESHRYNLLYICVRGACSSYGACVWGWFERHFFFFFRSGSPCCTGFSMGGARWAWFGTGLGPGVRRLEVSVVAGGVTPQSASPPKCLGFSVGPYCTGLSVGGPVGLVGLG